MMVTCRATNEPDESNPVKWEGDFAVGATADVSVHEKKDYGLVFDFSAHPDVLGLAAKHQVCQPLFVLVKFAPAARALLSRCWQLPIQV